MKSTFTLLLFLFVIQSAIAQSLLVGIPSADVAEKGHLEFTHETQYNFWDKPQKWNSFNFICFGMGKGLELTSTVNNLNNEGSKNLALGLGAKKVFNLVSAQDQYENKLVLGGNFLYSTVRKNVGVWTYGLYSLRIPNAKTRITSGLSYGNSQTYGFTTKFENGNLINKPNNKVVFLAGLEQPIYKNLSFVSDWYSGTHDLAALITALQLDIGHNILIMGYKFPNNVQSGNKALIVEFMLNIPTKREKS